MIAKPISIAQEVTLWRKKIKALLAHTKNTPTDEGPWEFRSNIRMYDRLFTVLIARKTHARETQAGDQ